MSQAEIIRLRYLPRGANPRPHRRLEITEVEAARDLRCPRYPACLAFAVCARWGGFRCTSCRYRNSLEEM